jgi:hypothetical protein
MIEFFYLTNRIVVSSFSYQKNSVLVAVESGHPALNFSFRAMLADTLRLHKYKKILMHLPFRKMLLTLHIRNKN